MSDMHRPKQSGGGAWGVDVTEDDEVHDFVARLFAQAGSRRPALTWQQVVAKDPEVARKAARLLAAPMQRPSNVAEAGAGVLLLRHGVKLPRLSSRVVEIALERELLPEALARYASPVERAKAVRRALSAVRRHPKPTRSATK